VSSPAPLPILGSWLRQVYGIDIKPEPGHLSVHNSHCTFDDGRDVPGFMSSYPNSVWAYNSYNTLEGCLSIMGTSSISIHLKCLQFDYTSSIHNTPKLKWVSNTSYGAAKTYLSIIGNLCYKTFTWQSSTLETVHNIINISILLIFHGIHPRKYWCKLLQFGGTRNSDAIVDEHIITKVINCLKYKYKSLLFAKSTGTLGNLDCMTSLCSDIYDALS